MHQDAIDAAARTGERSAADREPRGRATPGDPFAVHERERKRLAFDLHDGPAQAISAALLQVRLLDGASPEELREGLGELTGILVSALDDMYELIEQLHSRSIDREGLAEKIAAQVDEFTQRTGVATTLKVEGSGDGYSPSLQIATFRIVQEALNNVRQHAEASNVKVTLKLGKDLVRCTVEDDGHGFDSATVGRETGARGSYGLAGMRERASILGGSFDIETDLGRGTKVTVSLPVWRG